MKKAIKLSVLVCTASIGLSLVGCGGGAGGSVNSSADLVAVAPTRDFLPNYVPSINPLWNWSQRDLRIKVDQGVESSTRIALFERACQNWQTVTQGEIRPTVTQGTDAEISVRFVPEGSLGNALGVTETEADTTSGRISTAKIDIVRGLNDAELLLTIQHELAHAFGVGGHSPSKTDIMFAAPTEGTHISVSDTNTVLFAYKSITRQQGASPVSSGNLVKYRVN